MEIRQVERELLANTRIERRTVARCCCVVVGVGLLAAEELDVLDPLAGGSRISTPVGEGDGVTEPLPGGGAS